MSILLVTAFKDIRRGTWKNCYSRTTEQYIQWFGNLCNLKDAKIICFCDDDVSNILKIYFGFTHTFPYDDQNTFFCHIDEHKAIMNSPQYRSLVHGRDNPEYNIAEYNIVNHNKVEFVRRAHSMMPGYSHYMWIDFGFQRTKLDHMSFDWSKLMTDKIHYDASRIPQQVCEPQAMTQEVIIRGSAFVVPNNLVEWYYSMYKDMVSRFCQQGVVDDDQVIVSHVYIENKDKFNLHVTDKWFGTLERVKVSHPR